MCFLYLRNKEISGLPSLAQSKVSSRRSLTPRPDGSAKVSERLSNDLAYLSSIQTASTGHRGQNSIRTRVPLESQSVDIFPNALEERFTLQKGMSLTISISEFQGRWGGGGGWGESWKTQVNFIMQFYI